MNLEVAPTIIDHLRHQEQLSVGDEAISIHIKDLERDWVRLSVNSGFSAVFSGGGRTSQFSPCC
jgi:hypothetical protein